MCSYDCEICNSNFQTTNCSTRRTQTADPPIHSQRGFSNPNGDAHLSATPVLHTSKTVAIPFPTGGVGSSSQAFSTDVPPGPFLNHSQPYQASPKLSSIVLEERSLLRLHKNTSKK